MKDEHNGSVIAVHQYRYLHSLPFTPPGVFSALVLGCLSSAGAATSIGRDVGG